MNQVFDPVFPGFSRVSLPIVAKDVVDDTRKYATMLLVVMLTDHQG
jgi:hypothetical protein